MASDITFVIDLIKNEIIKAPFIDERRLWHQDSDAEIREVMVFCISQLIRSTDSDEEDHLYTQKLSDVAHYIENHLYFNAFSLKDYKDPITLVERVSYLCLKLLYDFTKPSNVGAVKAVNNDTLGSKAKSDSDSSVEKRVESPEIVFSSALFTSEYVTKQYENSRMTLKQSGLVNDSVMPPAASFHADNAQLLDTSVDSTSSNHTSQSTATDGNQQKMLLPISASVVHDSHNMIPPNVSIYPSFGHRPMPHNAKANTISVSSQGCSRVYIIKVLRIIAEFVRGKSLPSIFTFKKELVRGWLTKAKEQCKSQNYINEELEFGGPPFIDNDPSTHWLEPNQLYTWWKNNVERRQKFRILQDDAMYNGDDARKKMRARWCQAIVNLSEIIRRSSGSSVAARANMNLHNTIINNLALKRAYPPGQLLGLDGSDNLCNEEFPVYDGVAGDDEISQQMQSASTDTYTTPTERVRLKTKYDEVHLRDMRKEIDHTQRRREYHRKRKLGALDVLLDPDSALDDDVQVRTWTRTFPHKLYDLINASQEDVVCWAEDGKSFSIRNINRFITEVLPMSFKQKSFLSFQRQLNLYGFKRVPHILRGTYFHPFFIKGRIDLIDKVRRLQSHLEAEVSHYKKINKMRNTHQLLTLASNADLIDAVGLIPRAPGEDSPATGEPRQKRKYTKRTPVDMEPEEQESSGEEELEEEKTRSNLRNRKKYTRSRPSADHEEEDDEEEEDDDEDDEVEDRRLKSQIGKYNDEDFEYYNYKKVSSKASSKLSKSTPASIRRKRSESVNKRARANSFALLLDRFYNKLDIDTPADTDLLDLLQPKKHRIFLDFIYDEEKSPTKAEDSVPTNIVEVNSCGPFHGIYLPKSSNTVQSMYNADMATIRNTSSEGNLSRGFSRMSPRTNYTYNEPKSSRVGPEYQATCPDVIAASLQTGPMTLQHTVNCWSSAAFNQKLSGLEIYEFIGRMKEHVMCDQYLPLGSVLMVTVPDVADRRNRLVCILDYVDSSTMTSVNVAEMSGDNVLVRVYDGNQDLYVTHACIIGGAYGITYYGNAHDWLHEHNYCIPESKEEYKQMLDAVFKNLVPCPLSTWSSDEVETLLDGMRRFGDDVKKVYNLLVANNDNKNSVARTYSEVLAFYHFIFPHSHSIGARKVISLFNRAERAKQGFPDAESDDEDEEDDEGDYYSQDEMGEEESNIDDQEEQVTPETKRAKSTVSTGKKAAKQKSTAAVEPVEQVQQTSKRGRKPNAIKAKLNEVKQEAAPVPVVTSAFTGRKRTINPKYSDSL
jgi:hypothetical protein